MQGIDIDRKLADTLDSIKRQRPAYSELVDKFQDLFQTQASLARQFADHDFGLGEPDPKRSGQGVSLLADASLPECETELKTAARDILPVLGKAFPLAEEMEMLAQAVDLGNVDPAAPARAYLDGDKDALQETAKKIGIRAPILSFAIRCILAPVLAGMAQGLADALGRMPWTQGYCPFCGSPPVIASLSRFNNEREENLVGGGGKKRLTCSLCSHEWAFRRDACPACGNTDSNERELLFDEKNRHERIEACKKCGSYLLCIDLREVEGDIRLEAASLGLVHLDIIAQQKNYSPLAATPWNLEE